MIKKLSALTILSSTLLLANTVELKTGWNLVGSIYDNIDVNSTFSNANSVWKYNSSWEAISPNKSLNNSLDSAGLLNSSLKINAGEGYWVNNTTDQNITLSGDTPTSTDINISSSGWHLVSLKNDTTIEDINTTFNDPNINTIWKYSNGWKAYSPESDIQNTLTNASIDLLDSLTPSDGFWINTNDSVDIKLQKESSEPVIKLNKLVVFENIDDEILPLSNVEIYKDNILMGTTDLFGAIELDSAGTYTLSKEKYLSKTQVITSNDKFDAVIMESNTTVDIDGALFKLNEKAELIDIGNWNIEPQNTFVAAAPIPKVFKNSEGDIYVIIYEMSSTSGNDLTLSIVDTTTTGLENVVASFDMQLETSNGTSTTASEQGLTLEFIPLVKGDFKASYDYLMYQYDNEQWKLHSKVDMFANGKLKAKEKVTNVGRYAFIQVPRALEYSICTQDSQDNPLSGALVTQYGTLYENDTNGCFSITTEDNNTTATIYIDGYETKEITLNSDQDLTFSTSLSNFLGTNLTILHDLGTHVNYASIKKVGDNYIIPKIPKRFGIYDENLTFQYEINTTDTIFNTLYTIDSNIYSGSFAGEIYEYNQSSKSLQLNISDDLWEEGEFVYEPVVFNNNPYLPTANDSIIYYDNQFKVLQLNGDLNSTKDTVNTPILDTTNNKMFISNYGGKIWSITDIDTLSTPYDTNDLISNKAIVLSNNNLYIGSGTKLIKLDTNLSNPSELELNDRTYFVSAFNNKIVATGEQNFHIVLNDLSDKLTCSIDSYSIGNITYNNAGYIFTQNGTIYKLSGAETSCDTIDKFQFNSPITSVSTIDNMIQINLKNGQVLIGKGN